MIAVIILILTGLTMNVDKIIFDFSSKQQTDKWRIINDVVMGGVSISELRVVEDGSVKFSGILSSENNGGFASVRAYLEEEELKDYMGVIIQAKGDGKIYNLRFRTNNNYDGVSYQVKFESAKDEWKEFKFPFKHFKPTFRGRFVPNRPELESHNIRQVGIMIADEQWGNFELDMKCIKFYKKGIEL